MTTTTQQHAIDLMPQLRDLFDLAADHDLPRLARVEFSAVEGAPGWSVGAQLKTMPDPDAWDALLAWGHGAEPTLSDVHKASYMPSGTYRKASVTVTVAEVAIEVWCHVDGLFVPPQPVPVHVTGAFAGLLLGGEHA